jgi:hypothetical protein
MTTTKSCQRKILVFDSTDIILIGSSRGIKEREAKKFLVIA